MIYALDFKKKARKDLLLLAQQKALLAKAKELIEILKVDPLKFPPEYEKLDGDLEGLYSRRINRQHRLVYEIDEEKKTVSIFSMWSHYEF